MGRRGVVALLVVLASAGVAGVGGACKKAEPKLLDAGVPFADGRLAPGERQIERLQYNEVNDVYRVFLVGRLRPDEPERVQYLRLARIPQDKPQDKPYLSVDKTGPVAYLGPTFAIGIQHAFVEQRADLATGSNNNVVTRMEKRFWYPFGGKAVDRGADEPAFYYPPPIPDRGPVTGVGGRGATKDDAAQAYRAANGALPLGPKLRIEGFAAATPATNPDAGPALALPNVPMSDPVTSPYNNRVLDPPLAHGGGSGAKKHPKKKPAK